MLLLIEFIWLRFELAEGLYEGGKESWVSMESGKLLDNLNDYYS
jgi:hypothetical protein